MAKKKKRKPLKSKERIPEKVERIFELPLGTLSNLCRIEFTGNKKVVLDGCEGILEYTDTIIRLSTDNGEIRFTGSNLGMNSMTDNSAVIEGRILSLEFLS